MRGEQIPDLSMARTFKLLGIALFSLASFASPASADDAIRIGIISTTFGYAPVLVAKEKGFFKREGLDPEIVVISRNEQIVQALILTRCNSVTFRPICYSFCGSRATVTSN